MPPCSTPTSQAGGALGRHQREGRQYRLAGVVVLQEEEDAGRSGCAEAGEGPPGAAAQTAGGAADSSASRKWAAVSGSPSLKGQTGAVVLCGFQQNWSCCCHLAQCVDTSQRPALKSSVCKPGGLCFRLASGEVCFSPHNPVSRLYNHNNRF